MISFFWFLAFVTLIFGAVPFVMTLQFWRYAKNEARRASTEKYLPKIALIVPCKGTDLNFEANISAFLKQDYPNYEIIFVTATNDDPAYIEIERILNGMTDSFNQANKTVQAARLLVAGIEPGRGQKMTNTLKGIASISDDTEVLAFMDADIEIYPLLLQNLVKPLNRPDVGATNGIWVFRPLDGAFGAMLKFMWGAGAILSCSDQKNNLAIAAVVCVKRHIWEKAQISERLKTTVSDTMVITDAIRSIGLKIHFVPTALIISQDKSNLNDVVTWTNRLAIFSRVYNRPFWWKIFLAYGFQNLMILSGALTLIATQLGADAKLILPASVMFGLIILQIFHALITFPIIVGLLNEYPKAQSELRRLKWFICLCAPLVGVMSMTNSLNSLRTNIITWRGIQYRLKSATETDVLET